MNVMQNLNNNLPTFYMAVKIMIFGMVGIFVVLSLIYLSVKILGKLFPVKQK